MVFKQQFNASQAFERLFTIAKNSKRMAYKRKTFGKNMKKLRWRRIIILIIILILIIVGLRWGFLWLTGGALPTSESKLPVGSAISLPKVPLTPPNMSDAQKQDVINKLMEDAKASALASGQNEQQAEKFAISAGEVARQAMERPSTVDGDK